MLTDEIIANIWHESGNQIHKFARLLEKWIINELENRAKEK